MSVYSHALRKIPLWQMLLNSLAERDRVRVAARAMAFSARGKRSGYPKAKKARNRRRARIARLSRRRNRHL